MPSVENVDLYRNYAVLKHVASVGILCEVRTQETFRGSVYPTFEILVVFHFIVNFVVL
jgi:hypothetical protein